MTTELTIPEETQIASDVSFMHELAERYNDTELECDEDYVKAAKHLKWCKTLAKQVKDFMSPIVKAAHEAHKAAKARENETLTPIKHAQDVLGRVMGVYQRELAEAKRIAEAEERARLEREAAEAKAQYVDTLIENDLCDEAEAVEAAPPMRQEPNLPSAAPRVAGTAVRTNWCFEITDPLAIPREYLIPDEKAIGAMVRARREHTNIPGVRAYSETRVT